MTLFQHQQTCTGGEWGKTHCAVYVEGAAHWCTFWWGARLHLDREDIDGITTRSSSWSRRDGRRTRPMWDQPHISSSSGRRRSHPPPRRPRRASGRQHYHGRWGWTWVGNYTFLRLSRHPWGLMWSYHSGGGEENYPDWSNGAVGRRLRRGLRKEGYHIPGHSPTMQGQRGIAAWEEAAESASVEELSWKPGEDGQWLAIIADPPTGGYGSGSKRQRKFGRHVTVSSPGWKLESQDSDWWCKHRGFFT